MKQKFDYSTLVIGAGAGGLVVAIGLAKAGKKVLLIEKGNYGGDCTNFGCIPSKTLIHTAKKAHALRRGKDLGLTYSLSNFKGEGALEHTRQVVQGFLDHETPPALAELGVETLTGAAAFSDPHTLIVTLADGSKKQVTGNQIVIATGSHPTLPPVSGLESLPYLTNETVFQLQEIPESLAVIGGGAIGCELAQAFSRLGSEVTLIEFAPHLLFREEPEAIQVIEEILRSEGINLKLGWEVKEGKKEGGAIVLELQKRQSEEQLALKAAALLVAAGRQPNISALNLEKAGVAFDAKTGIKVDAYGRTTKKNIWAIGDVSGGALFTHVAESEGRKVLTNLLIPLPWPFKVKLDRKQPIPRVTFTDPEIASIGLTEQEAIAAFGPSKIAVYTVPFSELDRAITEGRTEGKVKIVTKKWSSKILGATIAAPCAGEMLMEISTAMYMGVPLRKLASLIHPYPIYNLAIRKAADKWLTQTILPFFKR